MSAGGRGINGLSLGYHWFYLGLSTPGDSLVKRVYVINEWSSADSL